MKNIRVFNDTGEPVHVEEVDGVTHITVGLKDGATEEKEFRQAVLEKLERLTPKPSSKADPTRVLPAEPVEIDQSKRCEEWRFTIKNGRVLFSRYHEGKAIESWRPTDIHNAVIDAVAIIQVDNPE